MLANICCSHRIFNMYNNATGNKHTKTKRNEKKWLGIHNKMVCIRQRTH